MEEQIFLINKRYYIDFPQDLQQDKKNCEEYIKKHRVTMRPEYPNSFFNPSYRFDESKDGTDLVLNLYLSFKNPGQLFMVQALEKILERKAKPVDSIPSQIRWYSEE